MVNVTDNKLRSITMENAVLSPLPDGTVYSVRKNFCPFSTPSLEAYASILGDKRIERLQRVRELTKNLKFLELSSTIHGGGVAEMLYSSIPFLNSMGIETDWKILNGHKEYFECTKSLHNMLQGKQEVFSLERQSCYLQTMEDAVRNHIKDYSPNVVLIHDPQPLGLVKYLKESEETWFWRCHIDIEEENLKANPELWNFMSHFIEQYEGTIFSAAGHVVSSWPVPKFIIPPFIDPLSEKNRDLSSNEIDKVLAKYNIVPDVPIIVQIGRFDPWKGIDRTIATYRRVREMKKCQLVLAGGLATDDPEGERLLANVYSMVKNDEDIHILCLSLENRTENYVEVNALQRAASVIMQPSTKEGFGLVITEALWKRKPVIAANVGAISLQIKEGTTGFFFDGPYKTAQKIVYLLEHPKVAERVGEEGKKYVHENFLLPDRIADYLMAIYMTVYGVEEKNIYNECVVSFRPWFRKDRFKWGRETYYDLS
jgi:trehalose synthase